MSQPQRSITPRTLHLQRRDAASGRTGADASTSRSHAPGTRRVVVQLNAGHTDAARASAVMPDVATDASSGNVPPTRRALVSDGSVTSENLLRGAQVVRILHNGESYQLRATRHGKLILTK